MSHGTAHSTEEHEAIERAAQKAGGHIRSLLYRHLAGHAQLDNYIALLDKLLADPALRLSPGSSHNHQAWPGGYLDHVLDCLRIAGRLYVPMFDSWSVPVPFTLPSVIRVLFLHDIEKPWRHAARHMPRTHWSTVEELASGDKTARKECRRVVMARMGITLTAEEENAMLYVEGEHDDYSPQRRVMNELAAFCHMCDVASARISYDLARLERQ
jgi:hypothetical protein